MKRITKQDQLSQDEANRLDVLRSQAMQDFPARTTMKITKFRDIPRFIQSNYRVTVDWKYLESWLADIPEADLNPDFQRGHVWTVDKQVKYVEFILRGGASSKDIYFNHPGWMNDWKGEMVLVDGKQRMEAVRAFMRDDLEAFGSKYSEFADSIRSTSADFNIYVNNLQTRTEVLQWYLDLNDGGVVHTSEELNRVRNLLAEELVK